MSKVATTNEMTVWKCDYCEKLQASPSAFDRPRDWWTIDGVHQLKRNEIRLSADFCCKECLVNGLQYGAYARTEHPKEAKA